MQHSSQDVSRRNLKGKVDQPRENTKKSQEGPDMREKKKKKDNAGWIGGASSQGNQGNKDAKLYLQRAL